MKKSLKRMVSFLLVLAMVFGLLPAIGITMVSAAAANIEGYLDTVTCIGERTIKVTGWAYDTTLPNTPLEIHIYVGGEAGKGYGTSGIMANVYREDLKNAGKGNGYHGFEAEITVNDSNYAHGVQNVYAYAISTDGSRHLTNSPRQVVIKNTGYGADGWTIEDDKCPEKPDGIYRIVPAGNPNFSLDIYWPDDVGLNDGTNLQLYSSHNTDGQLFYLQRIEWTNQVALMNIRSQKYLEVAKGEENGNVHQNGFLPENNNRRWILHHNADGTYSFESCADGGAKGQYLDISGGKLENGTNIGVWDSNGSAAQKFYLIPSYIYGTRFSSCTGFIRPGTYYVYAAGYTDKVLGVKDASIDQSANIQIWTKGTNNFAQVFDIQPDGEGWYTIKNVKSGRFLNAAGGSGAGRGANVQQYFDDTDACKWALIPKVSANGTDVNYWVVNKATSLYLNRSGGNAPSDKQNVQVWPITPKGVTVGDNNSNIASTWYFCRTTNSKDSPYYYAQTKGSLLNDNTGVAANNYNLNDTISLPIKIYDYPNDGLLFEYAESTADNNNRAFGMLRGSYKDGDTTTSKNTNYEAYAIGQTTYTSGGVPQWETIESGTVMTYFENTFWTQPLEGKTLNKILQLNHGRTACDANVDLSRYGRGYLNYSVYGTFTDGIMTMGLVKPTLREVNGYRLPDYNDETIAYIADLLEKSLRLPSTEYNYPKGETKYGEQLGFGSNTDLPGILRWVLNYHNDWSGLPSYDRSNSTTRRGQLRSDLEKTLQKTDQLTGTWQQCWQNIETYTDAAYFILNNLFVPRSYNLPQDQFDYLVLSKAKLTNGKTGYVFDAGFTTTVSALDSGVASAVKYDLNARTISNTSMNGKALYQFGSNALEKTTRYPFLPVFKEGSNTEQDKTNSPYNKDDGVSNTAGANVAADTYQNRNFNYVLQSNGVFTYDENEGLFFDFEGDDDVYLFINGQLVLDIGGAHSITKVSMNLNDYVFDARNRVANGTATARDRALALEDGKEYTFDFYYMERHGYGANMRIATNIRVSDPSLGTNKKAYQNGQELNYGGIVDVTKPVEYGFELSNPTHSTANLYQLTFDDAKLGVKLDCTNGLTVSAGKAVNSAGETLTAADLKIYFTNQQGSRSEVVLTGSTAEEKNNSLKAYLKELNGNGLLPGCSIEIQGMYLKLAESSFTNARYDNTVFVTANQKVDGTGKTYQDSAKMVVCIPSGPHYYQWSGKTLTVDKTKFVTDVNALLADANSALREQLGAVTSLDLTKIDSIQLCNMNGIAMTSTNVDATTDRISIHFSSPGSYTFYVKVHQKDGTQVIIPLQAYVTAVNDSVFVLDYGLKTDLGTVMNATDTLSVPGRSTNYLYEGLGTAQPGYANNQISFTLAADYDGDYKLSAGKDTIEYHPTKFMEGADSVYAAVRVYEGTPSSAIGTVNINTEVEMYKKITVLPANVVYYEDDFPAITYYGNGDGKTANTFTVDGSGSGSLYQSADQSTQYGYDAAYGTGTTMSGNSGHVIKILDTKVAAEFSFVGTGFELIGRSMVADKGVMYLDVLNASNERVKRIPVILEYEDTAIPSQTEGIYQVPIVRVDGLTHGKYKVQIHGVPVYKQDTNGNYVVDTANAPTLFIDGLRIYNPLAESDPNRDYYIDGEDTAKFLEIRNLILTGKAAVVSFEKNETSGALELTTNTSTYTENRNGVTYPVNTFRIKSVKQNGYFVDAETKTGREDTPALNLRTDSTVIGNNQFVFTFAKTENNTDYYYIHINSGGHERYLKRSAAAGNTNILLVSDQFQNPAVVDSNAFLWKITYLNDAEGIVTIQSKYDMSYLSVATVDASAKTGTIKAVNIDTITDAQKWELAGIPSQTVFKGNEVNSVNDYLVFGPNNELYLDGVSKSQALAFYFTPDSDTTTTTMLQVGVRVLNDKRLFGESGELEEPGALYQSANRGTPGWLALDEEIQTSTERYYPIDLSLCKYDAKLNRYEVVLYCGGGYLSFTNLKVSGGTIETITGETADLRYNNGVLELLATVGAAQTRTWVPVANPANYPDFASLTKQMSSTTMYEMDADTGEFVPALIESEAKVALAGRSLLFKDIIKMRFYFDISATGVTTASPENSGLLIWTEEEYAALDSHSVDTAGKKIRGLTHSVNGYYADTQGIPAKNMVDKLYVRAYVILPDGSYEYSDITEFSPVMYAQLILEKETSSETMKELVIALMNYGAAAQKRFNYKTDDLMNAWLPADQQTVAWSDEWINPLPTDTSKFTFDANEQITMVGSSVTFVGAVNQNFYFDIPAELTQNAAKIELLYWTESEYEELTELTVANAHHVDYDLANGRAVIEGTAAKNLGNAFYLVLHIENEDGDVFSSIFLDSAHDYARRVLASSSTSDAMKELAQTLVIYSNKAKAQLGG